jgi:hypothetical protein
VAATVVLILVLVTILSLVANWTDWRTALQDEVAEIPGLAAVQQQQQQQGSGSESVLLVVTDPDGQVGAIALVAVADDEPDSLTVIPTSLFDLLPGYGDFPLADAVAFEGPELARIAVANALGTRVDRVALLPPGALGEALSNPIDVELQEPILVDEGGDLIQIADAGVGSYDGALAERLLVERGESGQVNWLERQAAVWRGVLDNWTTDSSAAARLLGEGRAAVTVGRAAAGGEVAISLIPVTPVAVAGADDGFQLVQADVAAFVADRLAHLALGGAERPRVEVLNGNGQVLATRSVVEALVAAGFHVIKTDNAENFEFEETVVISQGRANLDAAEAAAGILGVRMVQLEVAAPSGVVDLSIIVGQDIATLRS